jgi:hypothetical protein
VRPHHPGRPECLIQTGPDGDEDQAVDPLEIFATETYDEGLVTQVLRPSAVLPEAAARAVLGGLAQRDARTGGCWVTEPTLWRRFDGPWDEPDSPGSSELLGAIQVAYGTPTRYQITIYRCTLTLYGLGHGLTVETLCNEALGFGGLDLASCPRADLTPPPQPFTM